jgi:hypothetical protein
VRSKSKKTEDMSAVKSMKSPFFDGAAKNFQVWWVRFMACAVVFGFSQALGTLMKVNISSTEAMVNPDADMGRQRMLLQGR